MEICLCPSTACKEYILPPLSRSYKQDSANFKAYGLTAQSVFQPCENIRVGSQILQKFYQKAEKDFGPGQKALQAALSAYNTGNPFGGFANGYVQSKQYTSGCGYSDPRNLAC